MTYSDVLEAIAAKVALLWPERAIYRDFCPADFQRPSSFIWCPEVKQTPMNICLVDVHAEYHLALHCRMDVYGEESVEELRRDQAAVIGLFPAPKLQVLDRYVDIRVQGEGQEPGMAYVRFELDWVCERGDWQEATAPLASQYQITISEESVQAKIVSKLDSEKEEAT